MGRKAPKIGTCHARARPWGHFGYCPESGGGLAVVCGAKSYGCEIAKVAQ